MSHGAGQTPFSRTIGCWVAICLGSKASLMKASTKSALAALGLLYESRTPTMLLTICRRREDSAQ